MGEPGTDDPRHDAAAEDPMSAREPIDVNADVIAGYAAGLDIDELCGIYRLERAVVEQILADVGDDVETKRRSRWLSAVTRRRPRHGDDGSAHTAAG